MANCTHDGFYSGAARYDSATRTLHYVLVCDACDSVIRSLRAEPYVPQFNPRGHAQNVNELRAA